MTWTPPPGTIGLTYSYGSAAFRATIGQALTNETASYGYSHAFVVLSDREIIEPWPSGARIANIRDYEDEYVAYCFLRNLDDRQRVALAAAALSLDGVKHGLGDYLALALHRYGWHADRAQRRMADTRRLLPAQFVAETYRRGGIELTPDLYPGDVTLADLGSILLASEDWELRTPWVNFGVRNDRKDRYAR